MNDRISRQAAISLPVKPKEDRYFQTYNLDDAFDYGWRSLQECIRKLPSAERKGNWVGIDDEPCETFECDRCGFVLEDWIQGAFYNFCPNCGADMREEENG